MALFPVLHVFWQSNIRHPHWKIPLKKTWKCDFRDSKFQNVPRCLGPPELVPLVRDPKPPTIHLRLACYLKYFWQPWIRIPEVFFSFLEWHLVKILLTGSNYKQKTICEVYIGIRHYEASFNQKRQTEVLSLLPCVSKRPETGTQSKGSVVFWRLFFKVW